MARYRTRPLCSGGFALLYPATGKTQRDALARLSAHAFADAPQRKPWRCRPACRRIERCAHEPGELPTHLPAHPRPNGPTMAP